MKEEVKCMTNDLEILNARCSINVTSLVVHLLITTLLKSLATSLLLGRLEGLSKFLFITT